MLPAMHSGPPDSLTAALATMSAVHPRHWSTGQRSYAKYDSAHGVLLARWSADPVDVDRYQHEATCRALVGSALPLRTPPLLASGPAWLVEPWVEATPQSAAGELFSAALEAVAVCAGLDLPPPAAAGGGGGLVRLRQRLGLLGSRLPLRHLLAARRVFGNPGLPLAGAHGDLHPGNTIMAEDGLWLIDWELSGREPFGFDALMLAASLDADLLAPAAEWIGDVLGASHLAAAHRLAYAMAVRVAAAKLVPALSADGDLEGGQRLAERLDALAVRTG